MHITPQKERDCYNKSHCWQYEVRKQNLDEDLKVAGLTHSEMLNLRICDFEFSHVPKK